ncbi:MAG TPA: pirin-like C-terminal cupin domain-containing protein, partial [Thermoanaerobaculia bacterium]
HIYWNFVSSSRDRIEQAKTEWIERRFPVVVGDEIEFVPLPPERLSMTRKASDTV